MSGPVRIRCNFVNARRASGMVRVILLRCEAEEVDGVPHGLELHGQVDQRTRDPLSRGAGNRGQTKRMRMSVPLPFLEERTNHLKILYCNFLEYERQYYGGEYRT